MRLALFLAFVALARPASAQVYEDWTTDQLAGAYDVDDQGHTYTVSSHNLSVQLSKIGPTGETEWTVNPSGTEGTSVTPEHVVAGTSGEVYVVGNVAKPNRQGDIAILRFESDGTLTWELVLDGPNSGDWPGNSDQDDHYGDLDRMYDAALMPDGALVVVGQTGYAMGDMWTVVVDPQGAVRWSRSYDHEPGLFAEDEARRVAVDCNGGVHVLGTGDYTYEPEEGTTFRLRHLQVVSYTADGTFVRADHYGSVNGNPDTGYAVYGTEAQAGDVVADCDGNVYAAGSVEGTGSAQSDWALFRIDPNSSGLAWVTLYGGSRASESTSSADVAKWLALSGDGALYAAGDVQRDESSPYRSNGTEVLRIDPADGDILWAKRNDYEAGNPTDDPGGLDADASGVVVGDGFVQLDPVTSGGTLRKYSPDGDVLWSLNLPYSLSSYAVRGGSHVLYDARGGVTTMYAMPLGGGIARFGQGERPLPLALTIAAAPTEAEPGVTLAFTLAASSDGTAVTPFDLSVEVAVAGTSVAVETVEASDGAFAFALPTVATPGDVYTFSFTASAEGYETAAAEVTVTVVTPTALAHVQIQHASAALNAFGPLEVTVDGVLAASVSYPDATVAVDLVADVAHEIRARLTASGAEYTFTAPPLAEGRYTASLAGIPAPVLASFATNPDGRDRALRIVLAAFGLPESGRLVSGVPVAVVHAVTDAPALDVVTEAGVVLADDLRFGEASVAATLPPETQRVNVYRADTGALVESVVYDLLGVTEPVTITVAGFLDPSANQGGPALAVVAVDETGMADGGQVVTGVEATPSAPALTVGPNPSRGGARIRFALPEAGAVRLAVVDAVGREVTVLIDGPQAAGVHEAALDARLAPGAYLLRLTTRAGLLTRVLTVVR